MAAEKIGGVWKTTFLLEPQNLSSNNFIMDSEVVFNSPHFLFPPHPTCSIQYPDLGVFLKLVR